MKINIGDYQKEGERNVDVTISDHDVWSLDSTLAYVIAPALRRLQENKHGYAYVLSEDIPADLDDDRCEHGFSDKAWNWVLEEMCWAFEQVNTDWEDQFWKNKSTDLRNFDEEGYNAFSKRMNNGFVLFGKYYRSLWD